MMEQNTDEPMDQPTEVYYILGMNFSQYRLTEETYNTVLRQIEKNADRLKFTDLYGNICVIPNSGFNFLKIHTLGSMIDAIKGSQETEAAINNAVYATTQAPPIEFSTATPTA